MTTPMIVYDPRNHELRTVVDYFAASETGVSLIDFRTGLEGSRIEEGMAIADVYWDDGSEEPLFAPPGCEGRVLSTNGRLRYDRLHVPPSQVLLTLCDTAPVIVDEDPAPEETVPHADRG